MEHVGVQLASGLQLSSGLLLQWELHVHVKEETKLFPGDPQHGTILLLHLVLPDGMGGGGHRGRCCCL
jgi:hypothetical protein